MDIGRDLACPALWQESLERSLARRGRPTRSSLELFQLRPERDLSRSDLLRESLMYSHLRRSAASRRPSMAVPGAGGISALALLAATTLPGLLGGGAGRHDAGERVAFRGGDAFRGGGAAGKRVGKTAQVDEVVSPALAAHATAMMTASVATQAASEPAHPGPLSAVTLSARSGSATSSSAHSARASLATAAPRHIALAHDTAVRGGAAHASSGGAAFTARQTSAAAPRVPAEPQPSGHPSTGGGSVAARSHVVVAPTRATASHPVPATHPVASTRPVIAAAPVSSARPVTSAPPVASTRPAGGAAPVASTRPVASTHPVTSTQPAATAHPVTATHPKPAPAPAPPPTDGGGYVNPLAHASVTGERIDQGVDYGGSGTLGAIGDGKITYVGTSGTGWPGAFIEFQLTGGPDAGKYVYYAENITPAAGLRVGQTVHAGQPIASINGQIEVGWGSGVGSQPAAQADGQWGSGSDAANVATPDGKSFSALVASLGGPAGKVDG